MVRAATINPPPLIQLWLAGAFNITAANDSIEAPKADADWFPCPVPLRVLWQGIRRWKTNFWGAFWIVCGWQFSLDSFVISAKDAQALFSAVYFSLLNSICPFFQVFGTGTIFHGSCQFLVTNNVANCWRCSVRYGAGRGGFSLVRPRPHTGPGGYVSGNPGLAPVPGPPALIPCPGPRLLPSIFNRDRSVVWIGQGSEGGPGHRMPKKKPRPWPLSTAGRGKGQGADVFEALSDP